MGDGNLLFESVFKRKFSGIDTLDYLNRVTREHPYFTPAQFFLLLKAEKATTEYQEQAAKTAVLFNNPYWLQFQLEEMQDPTAYINAFAITLDDEKQEVPMVTLETLKEDIVIAPDNFIGTSINQEKFEEIADSKYASLVLDDDIKLSQPINGLSPDPPLAEKSLFQTAVNAPAETDQIMPGDTIISKQENTEIDIISEKIIEEEKKAEHWEAKPANEDEKITATDMSDVLIRSGITHEAGNEYAGKFIDMQQSGHFNNEPEPLVNENEPDDDNNSDQEIEPLNFKLNIETSTTTEDRITFEPLHTSDYFASLGIKLSGEIPSSDKFGKQLKSFTEWLKTMKKVHNEQLATQSSEADLSIQKLAERSNKKDAVLTEAMAEVLLQQGKADKAIEVFRKLSLLNPSKSTYFAAKIDQLKEH